MTIADIIGKHVPLKRRGASFVGLCPFHAEKTASFTVTPNKDRWKCFGCGKGGKGSDSFLKAIGGHPERNGGHPGIEQPERIWPEIDWKRFVLPKATWIARKLADWRGFSVPFCKWLFASEKIGIYDDRLYCFPIFNGARIVRIHIRSENGGWFYWPRDVEAKTTAMMIAPDKADTAHVFESQWDMFACMDVANQHRTLDAAWIATRGACNAGKVQLKPYKHVRLYPQNDGSKRNGPMNPATKGERWLEDATRLCRKASIHRIPARFKDHNEALLAGETATLTQVLRWE